MTEVIFKSKDQNYGPEYIKEMKLLHDNGQMSDIVLIAGIDGQRFSSHRMLLHCSSPFFRAMFTSSMRESQQSEITLHEVSGEQLKPLLEFCYTREMRVIEDEEDSVDKLIVKKLLCTASLLQMDAALDVCVDHLLQHLTPANCLGIYTLAEQHSLDELKNGAIKCLQENFLEMYQQEEFLQMPFEQMVLLITSDQLNVTSEETVFRCAISWVQHDVSSRQHHIPELLKLVRLALLSPKLLNEEVRPICKEHDCVQLLIDVLMWKADPELPTTLSRQQTTPRWHSKNVELLGLFTGNKRIAVRVFCPATDEWCSWGAIDLRSNFAVTVVNKSLIFVGGTINSRAINTVQRFDLTNKTVWELSPIRSARYDSGIAVLDGMLYLVGGTDQREALNSVERFNPATNTWENVEAMWTYRQLPGVAVLDGLLYAVGGTTLYESHRSTECYNPQTNRWTECARMSIDRIKHGLVAAHGFLYAIGGEDQLRNLGTVERFDPRNNVWTLLCSLETLRGEVQCAVMGNRLLASNKNRTEVYDIEDNTWSPHENFDGCLKLFSIPKEYNLKYGDILN